MSLDVTTQVFVPATADEWEAKLLSIAQGLKLTVTSWDPGGVARTLIATFARALALSDGMVISALAQAGFLDYAASGTVTYVDESGATVTAYVSPDPSIPAQNPNGDLTWLDILADSLYDVQRILATYAGGTEAITNTSGSTYGPFAAGTYHVACSFGLRPSYANTTSLTISPSPVVGTVSGVTSAGGLVKVATSAAHGLSTGNVVTVLGVTGVAQLAFSSSWTVTVVDATHFTLDGSTFSGAYVSGGTVYTPMLVAVQADSIGSASNSVDATGVKNAHTVTTAVTSLLGVTVDNLSPFVGSDIESNLALANRCRLKLQALSPNGPKGAYEYFALSSQQEAPKLSPPQVVAAAITRALPLADKSTGSVVTTIANATGAPGVSDVAATDAVIQANCVPDGITATTQAAAEHTIACVVDVWVPAAYASVIATTAQSAVQSYFQALKIGGVTAAGADAPNTNVVPVNAVEAAVSAAAAGAKIPLTDLEVLLDGAALNVQLLLSPVPEVAVLSPAVPAVNVHTS